MAAQVADKKQPVVWRPNPGPQTRFLASRAYEVMYGGQAGGGKSAALVAMPTRWLAHPEFRALVLRRDTTQLGNLLDKAEGLYRKAFPRARFNANDQTWRFPSGAEVRFTHCQHEKDAARFDGDEFNLVEFDELTHFTLKQYQALGSRIRTPHPALPCYLRSTTNPGGPGHEWVFERWGPWLNPECKALPPRHDAAGKRIPPADPGQVLFYLIDEDGKESIVPKETPGALGRTFLPAALADTPQLEHDPAYRQRLRNNDPVRRRQLEKGDWLTKPAAGLYFKRDNFAGRFLDAVPEGLVWVRAWDLAATAVSKDSPDPDWTQGVKIAMWPGRGFVIADVASIRAAPGEVRRFVQTTAESDGKGCVVILPQDPGQAGVDQANDYVRWLAGFTVRTRRPSKDKVTRAGPLSSQCDAGNVYLVRGEWNAGFLAEAEQFPDGSHDDQIDAASDGFAEVASGPPARIQAPDDLIDNRWGQSSRGF
jgi:predicted phage terminase large subunit-like protein